MASGALPGLLHPVQGLGNAFATGAIVDGTDDLAGRRRVHPHSATSGRRSAWHGVYRCDRPLGALRWLRHDFGRVVGLAARDGGDLELSALHLYSTGGRVGGSTTLFVTKPPVAGALTALQDDDTGTACRFSIGSPSPRLCLGVGLRRVSCGRGRSAIRRG